MPTSPDRLKLARLRRQMHARLAVSPYFSALSPWEQTVMRLINADPDLGSDEIGAAMEALRTTWDSSRHAQPEVTFAPPGEVDDRCLLLMYLHRCGGGVRHTGLMVFLASELGIRNGPLKTMVGRLERLGLITRTRATPGPSSKMVAANITAEGWVYLTERPHVSAYADDVLSRRFMATSSEDAIAV